MMADEDGAPATPGSSGDGDEEVSTDVFGFRQGAREASGAARLSRVHCVKHPGERYKI